MKRGIENRNIVHAGQGCIIASMPVILAGLCSGASGTFSRIAASTVESTRTDFENFSPP